MPKKEPAQPVQLKPAYMTASRKTPVLDAAAIDAKWDGNKRLGELLGVVARIQSEDFSFTVNQAPACGEPVVRTAEVTCLNAAKVPLATLVIQLGQKGKYSVSEKDGTKAPVEVSADAQAVGRFKTWLSNLETKHGFDVAVLVQRASERLETAGGRMVSKPV